MVDMIFRIGVSTVFAGLFVTLCGLTTMLAGTMIQLWTR